jgi:YidC/Oxa1 family membrane protein insertase
MQQNNKMHPDDMRNLILFGVISILLWFTYDHFVLAPKMEAMKAAQEVAKKEAVNLQNNSGMGIDVEVPREKAVSSGNRIQVDNNLIDGSINLTGARLDDLSLKNYFKTVDRVEEVNVLSPANAPFPKYVEHGWVTTDSSIKVPDSKSEWKQIAGDVLSPDNPITLEWKNGQGLTFRQVVSVNENYAFTVVNRVMNGTAKDITLYPYSLAVRRGLPEDFEGRFIVHEGPMGYFGDDFVEKDYGKMKKEPKVEASAEGGWVALSTKNWLTALIPDQVQQSKFRMTYTKAVNETVKDRYQSDVMGPAMMAPAGGMIESKINFFAGAKKLKLLTKYEKEWGVPHFDLAVDFGLFYFLTKPFFFVLNFFYGFVGNFGVAIILFTVVLRICVFPLANTSFKSFAKMRQLAPQMAELKEKYPDDKQKLQQELVRLYQKEKVNPMAGCLPILVQIPIFFSLFKVLSNTIEMRHAPFYGWIQDLSAPDPTSIFNLFGLIPIDLPQFLMIGAWPCLMLVTMIIQRKLSPPPTDKMQAQIIAAMPWVMTFVLAQFAAGLVIYWTFNNLLSVLQQYIIMKRMGVDVDLIGNILGKKKEETPIDGVHAEAAKVEEDIEDALGIDQADTPEKDVQRKISSPKPKKKKKK